MTTWCLLPTLILYALASVFYLSLSLSFITQVSERKRFSLAESAFVLTLFGVLLHLIYLLYLAFQKEFVILSFISFGVISSFLWLGFRYQWVSLGPFFVPFGFILMLFSLEEKKAFLSFLNVNIPIYLHIFVSIVTLGLMVTNLLLGLTFWVHEKSLKEKRFDFFSLHLPPLIVTQRWANRSLRLGFIGLTFVLMTGAFLIQKFPSWSSISFFHIILALLAWMFYTLTLSRLFLPLGFKKILLLSLLGFVSLTASYLWI